LTVITGVSGSGKSSLAFDTIYAEGQRRYVESLSAYARQFLERMEKPDVDFMDGLAPAIAIKQKNTRPATPAPPSPPPRNRRNKRYRDRYQLIGTTLAGRRLKIIFQLKPSNVVRIITGWPL
jgi:excinuclease UvrABC ATPase subunit